MAGSVSSNFEDDEILSDINVTPLVDVTLVLLIVFMITVPAIVGSAQLKVELPEAQAADPTVGQLPIHLTVRREASGEVGMYLNDKKTDENSLESLIKSIVTPGSEPPAILAADKGIAYGEVVKVIDLLNRLGLHKISLETKRISR
jgi:biopolymer transport protein ExbD